ncbi:MAG TPA: AAA family ATPase [Candidatus Limnocylindrales bacterium]|nr:AAA family ATPase [Candidatus Limnocylindrales bacterium]
MKRPQTIKELRDSGYKPRTVKQEMRSNLIAAMERGDDRFPGIVGYDRTVIPQIENAILSGHDFILLGLRGQAKTRLLRSLGRFLDEHIPAIDGCELNDDPLSPICPACKRRVAEQGDQVAVRWIHRDERYREKLATPDVTIADLIGDIDPIKAANERRSYSDPEVMHYGIIPRTNRGIFAINELPDLQPRIQVGLLNILEEKDIQVRGFPIRLPLDIQIVFSANPEDYTNRGNIITPLRDRIASQIMTHYPYTVEDAMKVTEQEAWIKREDGIEVLVPSYIKELIETVAIQARKSSYVDQSSGVSVRMTIALLENVISNAERRAIRTSERRQAVRICDLQHALSSITGKVELVYEGEQEGAVAVAKHLIGKAVKDIFTKYFPDAYKAKEKGEGATSDYDPIFRWFAQGKKVEISDELPTREFHKRLSQVTGLEELPKRYLPVRDPAEVPTAMEFVLEALHQNSILAKERTDTAALAYSDMFSTMLGKPEEAED